MNPAGEAEILRLLRDDAASRGETFDRMLHRYMTHRFLAWVAASSLVEELCLTGSMLLDFFHDGWHRHARCVDFLALVPIDLAKLCDALGEVHAKDRRDGVSFDMASLRIESGIPFRGRQTLHGRVTGRMQGISRQVSLRIEAAGVHLPAFTDLPVHPVVSVAGLPSAHVRTLTAEAAIADRLESLYWHGVQACRFEDIADLFLFVESVPIDQAKLSGAIVLAFKNVNLPPPASIPASLQPEFTTAAPTKRRWKRFVQREHVYRLIADPEDPKPVQATLSFEMATSLLRQHISQWLLEIATPAVPVTTAAQASGSPVGTSRMSAQQLAHYIDFLNRK